MIISGDLRGRLVVARRGGGRNAPPPGLEECRAARVFAWGGDGWEWLILQPGLLGFNGQNIFLGRAGHRISKSAAAAAL